MKMTDDILNAYIAGVATDDQKKAVRDFMAEHPESMEAIAIMMEDECELKPEDERKLIGKDELEEKRKLAELKELEKESKRKDEGGLSRLEDYDLLFGSGAPATFGCLSFSSPSFSSFRRVTPTPAPSRKKSFDECLTDLLNEIDAM